MSSSHSMDGNIVGFRRREDPRSVEIFGNTPGGRVWVESVMEGGERHVLYNGRSYDEARMIAAGAGVPITDMTERGFGATGGDAA